MIRFFLILLLPVSVLANNVTNLVKGNTVAIGTNVSNLPSGGGGGPTTATDNFSRADANPISNPMSDAVSTWTSHPGDWLDTKIVSGVCAPTVDNTCACSVLSPSFSANQKTSITIGAGIFQFAGVRFSSGSGYAAFAEGTSIKLFVVVDSGGVISFPTQLGTVSQTVSTGDVISLEVSGSSLTVLYNGTSVITASDSTYTTGQPVIGFFQSSATITAFSATTL